VNCGLHDIKTNPQTGQRQVSLDHYAANFRAIIDLVATMGPGLRLDQDSPLVMSGFSNQPHMAFHRFAVDCDAYNAGAADAIMKAAGVPMIDLYTFTCTLGPDLYCDHVHFQEPVPARRQAAFIAGWLAHWQRYP
jgi:hypothetical protein